MEKSPFPSLPEWFKGTISKESVKKRAEDIFGKPGYSTIHNFTC
jgi:hypothetical protein